MPLPECNFLATFKRLFDHIRHGQYLPPTFIAEHGLHQCHGCSHWFSKLIQHSDKCKSLLSVSSSQSSQQVLGSSSAVALQPGAAELVRLVRPWLQVNYYHENDIL